MLSAFLILSVLIVSLVSLSKTRGMAIGFSAVFYVAQLFFAGWTLWDARGGTALQFFTFDNLGVLFHLLTAVISPVVFYQSINYLNTEGARIFRIYNISLIMLCLAVTGVYYANNSAVTWIFLEATTLATAGLVYHRRTVRSLEATWKYVFVSSVGIAIAYLGILMISTSVTGEEGLSYEKLRTAMAHANPLYMKMAFLLILTGYSCKLEVFPLYSVGVDANYAAPTPASALISTALVNAGFVALFRIYRVIQASEIYPWACNVLIITGLISVLIGAVYLRRTNNYKRFMTYSTVENAGIVLIGLGVGGVGIYAAILHLVVHAFLKSGMFMQIAQVGRIYGTYRMNRIGNYLNIYRTGGIAIVFGLLGLLAFPPSGLFISEFLIFQELIASGRWLVLSLFVLLMCLVIYTLCRRFTGLVFRPVDATVAEPGSVKKTSTWLQIALFLAAMVIGILQPEALFDFIKEIVS